MSPLLRALAALAVLAVTAPAHAFVRSTTVKDNPGAGGALWWRPRVITFVLNATAYDGGCASPAAAASAARASFPAWMNATQAGGAQPCTDFRFHDCGDTSTTALGNDGVNLVVFRSGRCIDHASDPVCTASDLGACVEKYNCWAHDNSIGSGGILALTTVTFNATTGEMFDADMELHSWDGNLTNPTGFYFTCASSPQCTTTYGGVNCAAFDIQNTVTHEAGHMLGLDHICDSSSVAPFARQCPTPVPTMAPTATLGDIDKRTLAPDDIDGVCSIYPAGGPTLMATASPSGDNPTTTVAVSDPQACPAAKSSGGCSSVGGGGLALLALALAFWRRSR